MREKRIYITDDCDLNHNRLELFQGDNGDWYISTLKEGERLGNAVRITTSGGRHADKVALAIYKLYEAMKYEDKYEQERQENKLKVKCR